MQRILAVLKVQAVIFTVLITILIGMILWPVEDPPVPLKSINEPFSMVDFSGIPSGSTLKARDGTDIFYKKYLAKKEQAVALLLHGSSAYGLSLHPLARTLAKKHITAYALDIRGHGQTGKRGDVDYINQPSTDIEDFISFLRQAHAGKPIVLVGFSAGAGLALKTVGLGFAKNIDLVLVSPFLGPYAEPTTAYNPYKIKGEKWAYPNIPRIIGLSIINTLGIHHFDYLSAIIYAADRIPQLTPKYSHRLLLSVTPQDAQSLLQKVNVPISLLIGEKDEIFYSESFANFVLPVQPNTSIGIIPNVNHIGMILNPAGHKAIIAEIKKVTHN